MKINKLYVKYNFSEDTARTLTENKNRIALMYGRELNRQKISEENGNSKDAEQAIRNQKRILRNGTKIVKESSNYQVHVIGKFAYDAIVVANDEADAKRKATYQAQHLCLVMNPEVTKTGKPIKLK